jgi:hypothetical protein
MTSEPEEPRRSTERVDAIVRDQGAHLWAHHDVVQTATISHVPSYFDEGGARRPTASRAPVAGARKETGRLCERRSRQGRFRGVRDMDYADASERAGLIHPGSVPVEIVTTPLDRVAAELGPSPVEV